MAIPEILQLKKVPSSRILTPPPAAKGYFNKEVNEMTAEFLRRMNKHKEDIIRNYENFQVYLKKNKINYKKLSPGEKLGLKKQNQRHQKKVK